MVLNRRHGGKELQHMWLLAAARRAAGDFAKLLQALIVVHTLASWTPLTSILAARRTPALKRVAFLSAPRYAFAFEEYVRSAPHPRRVLLERAKLSQVQEEFL